MSRARLALLLGALLALAPAALADGGPPAGAPPAPPVAPSPDPARDAALTKARMELAEAKARIEEARREREAAKGAGEEDKVAATSAEVSALEKHIVDLKRHIHELEGGGPRPPDAERTRAAVNLAEIQAALEKARVARKEADLRGDKAAEEAARRSIGELEERAVALKRKLAAMGGPDHVIVREFSPGHTGPEDAERRIRALVEASRILRAAGMGDRAESLERDAKNMARELEARRAAERGAEDRDLRREVAELREEVRQLRLLLQQSLPPR
jgi:hypothetical protein